MLVLSVFMRKEFTVFLFTASGLEDWTHIVAPSLDGPVVVSLKALIDECVHGRNYCRQVLCLYELSKVCVPRHYWRNMWLVSSCAVDVCGGKDKEWWKYSSGAWNKCQKVKLPSLCVEEWPDASETWSVEMSSTPRVPKPLPLTPLSQISARVSLMCLFSDLSSICCSSSALL